MTTVSKLVKRGSFALFLLLATLLACVLNGGSAYAANITISGIAPGAPLIGSFTPNQTYLANQQTVTVAPTATITSGQTNFFNGSLTISFAQNGAAEDQLSFIDGGFGGPSGTFINFNGSLGYNTGSVTALFGPISGGTNGSPLVFTLNNATNSSFMTPAIIQSLLQNITYKNTANLGAATANARTVQAVVNDGTVASTPATLTITVSNPPATTISKLTPNVGVSNFPYSGTATVSNGFPPYNSPAFTNLPSGLTPSLNGSTITLSGTVTSNGNFSGNITVKDQSGSTATQPYTLTINSGATLGVLTPSTATPNSVFSGKVAISGGLPPFSSPSFTNLPNGMNVGVSGGAVTLQGVPSQLGTYTGTVSAKDATGATFSRMYSLTVNPSVNSTFVPGNLLVSKSLYQNPPSTIVVGKPLPNGVNAVSDATYPFVFANAVPDPSFGITNPFVIDQLKTDGTFVSQLQVPTSVIVNSFSSKSEEALNLSQDRSSFTFVDYVTSVNMLDVSNTNTPAIPEAGNANTTPPTYRAVVEMDLQGNFKRTTTNAYSGNNGRAAVKIVGPNQPALYVCSGNAGAGNGSPQITNAAGSQIVIPGQNATAGTPGTIQTGFFDVTSAGLAADKTAKDNNFRGLTLYNNTIYVTKGSGGNGINTVYQIGNAGQLPSLASLQQITVSGPNNTPNIGGTLNAPITILPGFPKSPKASSATLFPFGLWFANQTTLYVTDEGLGGTDSTTATNTAVSNGGLQKWILVNGTWQLAYTLTNGLNLGQPYSIQPGPNGETYPTGNNPFNGLPWAVSTDGLRNIIGQTNADGTVTLYAVTSTVSGSSDTGCDPNYVVAITDNPAFTTAAQAASEQFTAVAQPTWGVAYRGVALLPNPPTFNAVSSGDVSSSDVILWTRCVDPSAPSSIAVTLQVATDVNFNNIFTTMNGNTDPNQDYTIKLNVTGLSAGTRYYYRFVGPYGVTSNTGTFKTAPSPTAKAAVHFAFSGDADGRWRSFPSVSDIGSQQLDFFFFCGDTMYENASSPAFGIVPASPAVVDPAVSVSQALSGLRRKYLENIGPVTTNGNASLKNFFAAQANYTLLDNHELCSNIGKGSYQCGGANTGAAAANYNNATVANDINVNGPFANKTAEFAACIQAFRNYEPIRENLLSTPNDPRSDQTYQLYRVQQWGKNMVFINTDDRSYADQRASSGGSPRADNVQRTRLGATQLAWLQAQLLSAQQAGTTWKIVGVSDPIDTIGALDGTSLPGEGSTNLTIADGPKSWMGGYRYERNVLLKFIADNKIQNVVFLATDDHTNRVNEMLYAPDMTQIANLSSYVLVPGNVFSIVAGPMGASGPELFTDHNYSTLLGLANGLAGSQKGVGVNPIGLDPAYIGLHDVVRENDPTADSVRGPIDFFSPDTENYNVLDITPDGKSLTVTSFGINSYNPNLFLEPSVTGPVRQILSFSVDAYVNPVTLATTAASGVTNVAIPLSITTTLAPAKIQPTLSILASSLPAGATLSAGTLNNGVYTLTAAQLAGLAITVPTAGSYNLSITANALDTNKYVTGAATATLALTVGALQSPTAVITSFTGNVTIPATIAFDASASTAGSLATITTYAWDFGDGMTASGKTVSHTYTVAGLYTVTLTVTNSMGVSATTTATVTAEGVSFAGKYNKAGISQASCKLTLPSSIPVGTTSKLTIGTYSITFAKPTPGKTVRQNGGSLRVDGSVLTFVLKTNASGFFGTPLPTSGTKAVKITYNGVSFMQSVNIVTSNHVTTFE